MLFTLAEILVESATILAVVAATSCLVYLLALMVLERRMLRRLHAERHGSAAPARLPVPRRTALRQPKTTP